MTMDPDTCAGIGAIHAMLEVLITDLEDMDLSHAGDLDAAQRNRAFAIAWAEISAEAVRRLWSSYRAPTCANEGRRRDR